MPVDWDVDAFDVRKVLWTEDEEVPGRTVINVGFLKAKGGTVTASTWVKGTGSVVITVVLKVKNVSVFRTVFYPVGTGDEGVPEGRKVFLKVANLKVFIINTPSGTSDVLFKKEGKGTYAVTFPGRRVLLQDTAYQGKNNLADS